MGRIGHDGIDEKLALAIPSVDLACHRMEGIALCMGMTIVVVVRKPIYGHLSSHSCNQRSVRMGNQWGAYLRLNIYAVSDTSAGEGAIHVLPMVYSCEATSGPYPSLTNLPEFPSCTFGGLRIRRTFRAFRYVSLANTKGIKSSLCLLRRHRILSAAA